MSNRSIIEEMRYNYYKERHIDIVAQLLAKTKRKKILIPCLELVITTSCTLCCENCSNLMQYYENPYILSSKDVLSNLDRLIKAIDGISCLRIIGGEPLISPELYNILLYAKECNKIENILIVTNGTLLFSKECMAIMKNNAKIKISISDYGENSRKISELEKQLIAGNILFSKRKVIWRNKADVKYRSKDINALNVSFSQCPNRFFSLLNNELHMCPRSAHGTDLQIIPKHNIDFIELNKLNKFEIRRAIFVLLKRPYITACNFCDEDISEKLHIVEAGKQCSRTYALEKKYNIITENRKVMDIND